MKVKVVAERGKSDNGYVALDGIFLDTVQCSVFPEDASPSHSTPSPPVIRNCDFEEDFCEWSVEGEEFLWKRSQGSQEDGTDGPSEDHLANTESRLHFSNANCITLLIVRSLCTG